MNLATLHEFEAMQQEIESIAYQIIQERYPDVDGFSHYLESYDLWPLQEKISLTIEIHGARGWTDHEVIHLTFEEFCNPKYLLDNVEENV